MTEKRKSRPPKRATGVRRRTLLAGAGAVAVTASRTRSAKAAKPEAKKYRVGVVGHSSRGGYGHGMDMVWLDIPQAEIVGVADPIRPGRAKALKRLGAGRGFADYRKMFDTLKPDLVSIGMQYVDEHPDVVVAAAERGVRGIYIEKPLCRTLEQADRMVAACRKHGVKLAMAHQSRYVPKMKVIREIIRSGKLGRVLEFRGRGKEDQRGGAIDLWVLGTRVLGLMQTLGGRPLSCLATVLKGGRPITRKDVRESRSYGLGPLAGDEVHAVYRLGGGAMGYFDSIRNAGAGGPWRYGLRILGTKGALEIHNSELFLPPVHFLPDPLWSTGRSAKKWIPVSSAGIGLKEPLKGRQSHHQGNVLAVKDLIASIEQDRPPLANLADARTNIEMIVAVFEAHRLGGSVSFPLKNRKNPMTMIK